jgi:hypothetical protein
MSAPVYLKRQHSLIADFVVYHRDLGPGCSIWMVPGTHTDGDAEPYRSAILAADHTPSGWTTEEWNRDRACARRTRRAWRPKMMPMDPLRELGIVR